MRTLLADMRSTLASKTGQATGLAIIAQFTGGALGFALNLLLIRALSVDEFGLFSLFNSAMMILAGFMHWGYHETHLRYGSLFHGKPEFEQFRQTAFNRLALVSLIGALVALVAAPWVAGTFYERPGFSVYLMAAVVGAVILTLFHFVSVDLRVRQQFNRYLFVQVTSTVLRFVVCGGLLVAGALSLKAAVGVYVLAPVLFCGSVLGLLGSFARGPRWRLNHELDSEMSQYANWLVVSAVAFNLAGNLGSQIIAHYHDNATLGALGVVSRLTLPLTFVMNAMSVAIVPRLSSTPDLASISNYLRRLTHFLVPSVVVIVAAAFIAPPALGWLAGSKYASLDGLIRLQILAMVCPFVATPIGLVLFALGKSRAMAGLNVLQLLVGVVFGLLWIPEHGAAGALWAALIVGVVNLFGTVSVVFSRVRALRR